VDTKAKATYVTNGEDNTVSVISGRTNTVTATIAVGAFPQGVAADSKAKATYVASSGTVSVLAACPK
jgi:YVTN family beta-propeller protein